MKDGNGNPLSPDQEAAIRNGVRPAKETSEKGLAQDLVAKIARKHGVGVDAVEVALAALRRGKGSMAQFSHPEFGGMAQWTAGGMSMVGDMFNAGTKAKLDGVLHDLADALRRGEVEMDEARAATSGLAQVSELGWPAEFGRPATAGSQNDLRYAFFPTARRLVIEDGTKRTVYDTGEHIISGVSQQQSSDRTLTFQSQLGVVDIGDLPILR